MPFTKRNRTRPRWIEVDRGGYKWIDVESHNRDLETRTVLIATATTESHRQRVIPRQVHNSCAYSKVYSKHK